MSQKIITIIGVASDNAYSITEFNISIEKLVNRSIQETLDLGWELLGYLPKEELDRVDTKLIDQFYVAKSE